MIFEGIEMQDAEFYLLLSDNAPVILMTEDSELLTTENDDILRA